jgi:hypothetical protein
MRERDRARGGRRYRLWQEAVATYGVPRYLGSKDDLLLMLMKAQNPKNETKCYLVHPSKGVKFLGRFYVAPQVLGPLSGRAVEIRFDRRDISVIYIFYNGAYQGAAPCPELAGRRYSIWEHEADVKMANADKRAANKESLEARRHILRLSKRGKAAHRKEAEKTEKERQFKMQELDIHTQDGFAAKRATPAAQATINLLERDETAGHSPLHWPRRPQRARGGCRCRNTAEDHTDAARIGDTAVARPEGRSSMTKTTCVASRENGAL